MKKTYYFAIDLLRILACLSVLLFHLGLFKGGYLAVITFLVMNGYFSFLSIYHNKNFSIIKYYKEKIVKLYFPMLIMLILTIIVIYSFDLKYSFNKNEIFSILFGYNNFWQINKNLNYFAKFISSPFTHLWYISILLQFDFIFPICYKIMKKIQNKIIIIFILIIIFLLSLLYCGINYYSYNNVVAYFNTFSRLFSIMAGIIIAYFQLVLGKWGKLRKSKLVKYILGFYIIILLIIYTTININDIYLFWLIFLVTIISCRIILLITSSTNKVSKKKFYYLSQITYHIYLWQYPVIFLVQNDFSKTSFVLIIFFFLFSWLLICKLKQIKLLNCFILFCLLFIYSFFCNDFTYKAPQMESNEVVSENKKENYLQKIKKEKKYYDFLIQNDNEDKKNAIYNLPIIGIGDSVMLGAISDLYKKFPNGYFDAKLGRNTFDGEQLLTEFVEENILAHTIVINLGNNGDCTMKCKKRIMELCKNKEVFWINTVHNFEFNQNIESLSMEYKNLHVINWHNISLNHKEYFIEDKIHLSEKGQEVFAKVIYDFIENYYLNFNDC